MIRCRTVIIILTLLLVVITISCSENNLGPEHSNSENSNKEIENVKPKSGSTVRYDNFSDSMQFVVTGNRWFKYHLTYHFSNGTSDISGSQEKQAIEDAFDIWSAETDFTFHEVSSQSNADIVIFWATGDHGDGPNNAFDGQGGILAHAFLPQISSSYAGDIHFDDAEMWTISTRNDNTQPIDLVTVAAHEIGHSLGLGHSQVYGSLMYPYYNGSHRYLSQDDKDGIDAAYPLEVTIDGPNYADKGGMQTFGSIVRNDEGTVSYQWYYQTHSGGSWILDSGETSASYTRIFDYPNGAPQTYQQQAVKLVINSAGETSEDTHHVDVIDCDEENHLLDVQMMSPCRENFSQLLSE